MEINSLALKSGGAVHVRTADGDWLVDTGSLRDYDRIVQPYLRSRGINRLQGLILTHGDAGHMGGAGDALLDFHPQQLIDTSLPDRSLAHRRLIADLARNGDPRRLCVAGDEVNLSREVKARVLFPPAGFQGEKADDQALVFQLIVSGRPLALIMSDSGVATEEFLVRHYSDLRSELILKGQHHSGLSGSEAFLDSVRPKAIVATSRDFPDNERIKKEWVERLDARGIKLFRQDETGAVRITFFRDGWEAKSYLTSETFRSTSR
jgi:competence protein ComEC